MRRLGQTLLIATVVAALGCNETKDPAPGGAGTSLAGASNAGQAGQAGQADAASGGHAGRGGNAGSGGVVGKSGAAGQSGVAGEPGTAGESGAAGEPGEVPSIPTLETILDTYRTYTPRTDEPFPVSGYIFGLCRAPTLLEDEFLASLHGEGRFLRDWLNAGAQQGYGTHGAPAFPEGAVIVKEKYAGDDVERANVVAIGFMIKRPAGFDPARGDWDYAYYEPALGVVQTAEQSDYCANCHERAATTDYVFVDGLGPRP